MTATKHSHDSGILLLLRDIDRLRAENAELVAALYKLANLADAALAKHKGGA